MEEVVPGIHHWSAVHPRINHRVHSYYVEPAALLIDPLTPEEGIEALDGFATPAVIGLMNRHHYRHSGELADRFGARIVTSEKGLHEFQPEQRVEGFAPPADVAGGVRALEIGAICPDECAFHIDHGAGAIAFADGLVRAPDGALGFVPDSLLGDDPENVKAGLRESFARLMDLDFDTLLFAHGEPIPSGGRELLGAFLDG